MRVQRVVMPETEFESRTVLGDDQLPVEPVERFLAYLASIEKSPNTIKAYAHDLKDWFTYPAARRRDWRTATLEDVAGFVPPDRRGPPSVGHHQKTCGRGTTPNGKVRTVNHFRRSGTGGLGIPILALQPDRSPRRDRTPSSPPRSSHTRPAGPTGSTTRLRRLTPAAADRRHRPHQAPRSREQSAPRRPRNRARRTTISERSRQLPRHAEHEFCRDHRPLLRGASATLSSPHPPWSQPYSIHQLEITSVDLLARVEPAHRRADGVGAPDRLSVHAARRGHRIPAFSVAHPVPQRVVQPVHQAVLAPPLEVPEHRRPRRKVMGQLTPRASGAIQVQDRLHNAATRMHRGTTTPAWLRHQRFDQRPLRVGEIGWITLTLGHTPTLTTSVTLVTQARRVTFPTRSQVPAHTG